jgi:hypothetical protein
MSTIRLYEDNAGGLSAHKDDGPVWYFGVCGAVYGPDPAMFAEDAAAWLDGDWEPSENDGQHADGETEPGDDISLIATYEDGSLVVIREQGSPVAGGSGEAYLGVQDG